MNDFTQALDIAFHLIINFDDDLYHIISLSLYITTIAVLCATIIGLLLAALLAITDFSGKNIIITLCNSFMGLPPVVVGLSLFLLFSRLGYLGSWGILFTPTIMIIAQFILILPIITALAHRFCESAYEEYYMIITCYRLRFWQKISLLLYELRYRFISVIIAGFGRGVAEVGAIIIVGGNINHVTRVMTTSIILESQRGNMPLAIALGIILMVIFVMINILASYIAGKLRQQTAIRHW